MARLAGFKVNADAIENGEWQSPGDEYDDLEIKVRGFTDAYYDSQAARLRRAAAKFGGDVSKVPNAVQKDIRIECLIAHVVLDVRNLTGPDGKDVDFAAFCGLLRDPNFGELVVAVMKAAAVVGRIKAEDAADAAGN